MNLRLANIIAASGLAILVGGSAWAGEEIYPGYSWSEIGASVYLHSPVDPLAGPVDGNSVVIINEHDVFVVDTHINPAAARAVVQRIRRLTDRPVTHIVNTHWHDDHTNGNYVYRQAFPEAKIIAHRATLAALEAEWPEMEAGRSKAYENLSPEQLLAAADKLEDLDKAIAYRVYAGYVAALKPELPTLELVYPDTVIDDRLTFDCGSRRIVVEWLGRGNTDGDVVVELPDDGILITGDLLVAPVPFAFDSPMTDWAGTLQRLADKDVTTLVPGHGAVQYDKSYLMQVTALLQHTIEAVRDAHEAGAELSELDGRVEIAEFERRFTGGNAERAYAWRTYYLNPGLKSAWVSLGYPVPD
ncbi:MAG: MBL fold metallo-hydrolase [Halieaceae bacterium]|nr:MBL fold metallo-hydrolase [Halieaceae bacterium]